jgi:2-polyprenyl-3-methyl-5-hydroxy-6-metoxy-1,4-benzoquinol methylase
VLASANGYDVIECEECGWAHLDPIPQADALAGMYAGEYYEEHYPDTLDNDFNERKYWQIEHQWKLDVLGELLGHKGRILDVGASLGLFVQHAVADGWSAMGIEPSERAWEFATRLGVPVLRGTHDTVFSEALHEFDVVHCKLVLEHLPDPVSFLSWADDHLAPDGLLCVQVPNEFNPFQSAVHGSMSKPKWWIAPPFHINYFTFSSLERLLSRCGFRPCRRLSTFPMELFLLLGFDYIGNGDIGRDMHRRRMTLEERLADSGAEELRRTIYEDWAQRDVGREAIVFARREARP